MKIRLPILDELSLGKYVFYGPIEGDTLAESLELSEDEDIDYNALVARLTEQVAARGVLESGVELVFDCFLIQGEKWDCPEVGAELFASYEAQTEVSENVRQVHAA